MRVEFSKLAYDELEDARGYYNLQQEELGEQFKEHIQKAIDVIAHSPQTLS